MLTVHRNKIQLKWDNLFGRLGDFVVEAQYADRSIAIKLLGESKEEVMVAKPDTSTYFYVVV